MYNRGLYNRIGYNISLAEFVWRSLAAAETVGEGTLLITRRLSGAAVGETSQTSALTKILFFGSHAAAETSVDGYYIRVRFFASQAKAEAFTQAKSISKYEKETFTLPLVNMVAGDELIIDTEAMTVMLNGTSIQSKIGDDAIFFKLKYGANNITVSGGSTANIKIAHRGRWL